MIDKEHRRREIERLVAHVPPALRDRVMRACLRHLEHEAERQREQYELDEAIAAVEGKSRKALADALRIPHADAGRLAATASMWPRDLAGEHFAAGGNLWDLKEVEKFGDERLPGGQLLREALLVEVRARGMSPGVLRQKRDSLAEELRRRAAEALEIYGMAEAEDPPPESYGRPEDWRPPE